MVNVAFNLCCGNEFFSVYLVLDVSRNGSCLFVKVGISALFNYSLREDIGREGVVLFFIREVVHTELYGICAVSVGVVSKLSLDLAVGCSAAEVFFHHDVGVGIYRVSDVRKTRTLFKDGIV